MSLPGCAGESSCKRQENGDAIVEPDRPLKKARYAWEVKGKYHLRNETSTEKSSTGSTIDRAGSSNSNDCDKLMGSTEQNLEILGDYLLKQDFNTLDSVPENNVSLLPSSNIAAETLSYPRYVSSLERINQNSGESSSNATNCTPVPKSFANSNKDVEDQCIARWQARQMAKCFVDNTINRVLDNWMIAPLPAEVDNRVLALDAAEFINNLPSDNSIENEAILMAISAHGLQNNSSSSSNTNDSQNSSKDLFLSPPSSPLSDLTPETNMDKQITEESSNDITWNYSKDKQNVNNNLPLSFFPETSSSSYQYYNDSDNLNRGIMDYDGDENVSSNDNDIMNNPYDFLDAAVSFAIQYKGLTSYGTDYG